MSFFDLRLLITPLASSNFSCYSFSFECLIWYFLNLLSTDNLASNKVATQYPSIGHLHAELSIDGDQAMLYKTLHRKLTIEHRNINPTTKQGWIQAHLIILYKYQFSHDLTTVISNISCMSFFDLRLLKTPLTSTNFSCYSFNFECLICFFFFYLLSTDNLASNKVATQISSHMTLQQLYQTYQQVSSYFGFI
jgi:hypothetical protein